MLMAFTSGQKLRSPQKNLNPKDRGIVIKKFHLILPVKDIHRSKTFYENLGFILKQRHRNHSNYVSYIHTIPDVSLTLYEQTRSVANSDIHDKNNVQKIILSLEISGKSAFDKFVHQVLSSGGNLVNQDNKIKNRQNNLYFEDPDKYLWNVSSQ